MNYLRFIIDLGIILKITGVYCFLFSFFVKYFSIFNKNVCIFRWNFVLRSYRALINGRILRAGFFYSEEFNWCPFSFLHFFIRYYVFSSTCIELVTWLDGEEAIHMERGRFEGSKYYMAQITVTPHLFLIQFYQSYFSSTWLRT